MSFFQRLMNFIVNMLISPVYAIDTQGNTLGGGEVLQYVGQDTGEKSKFNYMDNNLISQISMIWWVRILIIVLIAVAIIFLFMHVFRFKSVFKGAGITRALEHMNRVKKHDEKIIRLNRMLVNLKDIVELTPFKLDKQKKEYLQYNITRCGIRTPGDMRDLTAEEFNALIMLGKAISVVLGILTVLFISIPVGFLFIILAIFALNMFPMLILRSMVNNKDDEIRKNFSDFYLMIHYTLMANASTSLANLMRSYDKTTDNAEMHKFVSACIHNIETYGEYEATTYIAREYREIPEVGKLMRLIKQANEGGEVKTELIGFRQELLNARKYAIEKAGDKLVQRGQWSFNILMPVLVQAIISAMSIYFGDIFGSLSLF